MSRGAPTDQFDHQLLIYAAFTLSGFDAQERNLTFVKTAFQVIKLNFLFAV